MADELGMATQAVITATMAVTVKVSGLSVEPVSLKLVTLVLEDREATGVVGAMATETMMMATETEKLCQRQERDEDLTLLRVS